MPSAFWSPCQTRLHLAPAAITLGMPVTVTSLGGGGVGKVLWAFPVCGTRERNSTSTGRNRVIGDMFDVIPLCLVYLAYERHRMGRRDRSCILDWSVCRAAVRETSAVSTRGRGRLALQEPPRR